MRSPGRTLGRWPKVSSFSEGERRLMWAARIEAPGHPGLAQPVSAYQPATPNGGASTPSSSSLSGTRSASTRTRPEALTTTTRSGLPFGLTVDGPNVGADFGALLGDG